MATLNGATTVDDTFTVTGAATLDATLTVAGVTSLDGATTVANNLTVNSNLIVTSYATFNGATTTVAEVFYSSGNPFDAGTDNNVTMTLMRSPAAVYIDDNYYDRLAYLLEDERVAWFYDSLGGYGGARQMTIMGDDTTVASMANGTAVMNLVYTNYAFYGTGDGYLDGDLEVTGTPTIGALPMVQLMGTVTNTTLYTPRWEGDEMVDSNLSNTIWRAFGTTSNDWVEIFNAAP